MTDAPSAWSEVGARFSALGQTLRTHFEEARSSTTDEAAPPASDPAAAAQEALAGDAPATTTGERGPDPSTAGGTTTTGAGSDDEGPDDAVRAALRRLGDAIDGVVTAVGATVSDPKVKHDAKDVGSALSEALSRSFATVSEDLRKAFSKVRGGHDADPEGGITTTEYGYPTTTEAPPETPPSSAPER